MSYNTLGDKASQPVVFQPDSLVSEHLIDMMVSGQIKTDLLQIVITDLTTKHQQIVLIGWKDGSLGDLTYRLYSALTEDDQNSGVMETFFWLFWRGWAGVLDPNVIGDLPNAGEDIVTSVAEGSPLRGEQLRKFRSTIVWAFANAVGTWGDTDAWKTGDLSPSHLQLRQAIETYIEKRMVALHGENYENA
jgi:hypothetical protein